MSRPVLPTAPLDWPGDGLAGDAYAAYAPVYDLLFDDLTDDLDFYSDFALEHLPAGAAVLDLGCGTGRLTARMLREGYRLTGLDNSPAMLALARQRLGSAADQVDWVESDFRQLDLPQRYDLAVAPYGTLGHLLTDADRLAAFRAVHAHLRPGGWLCYDDRPSWLSPPPEDTALEVWRERWDPASGQRVRLMSNHVQVAGQPYSLRYDFLDWLTGDRVGRRAVVRLVFRDIHLDDELALLRAAGFARVEQWGGFDGRPFDPAPAPGTGARLILAARRADG
ncbi:MAG: methyltransferase domain-containing protein [Fimbriimonadaceae bacterium]|nr:methyltransferase domain-containing protein [Fimbriimonadaceae bacterium]